MENNLRDMFAHLLRADLRTKSGKTVEVFGWLILFEGLAILLAPHFVVSLLQLPDLNDQAENYFRLVGLLVSGLGMLYTVSGRLNARGFIFASLLDRPLVPLVMLVLWYLGLIPWQLALIFSIQDFGSFLWTLSAWKSES